MRTDTATPMGRSVIVTRLERAISNPDAAERFPLLVDWLDETLSRLVGQWGRVEPLPSAPAFDR